MARYQNNERFENIEHLHLKRLICNVEIETTEDQTVTLTYEGTYELVYHQRGNDLHIEMKKNSLTLFRPFGSIESEGVLTLTIPRKLETLTVSKNISRMTLNKIAIGRFTLRENIGEMRIEDVQTKRMSLREQVGETYFTRITVSEEVEIRSTVGVIHLEQMKSRNIFVRSTVGEILMSRLKVEMLENRGNVGRLLIEDSEINTFHGKIGVGKVDVYNTTIERDHFQYTLF